MPKKTRASLVPKPPALNPRTILGFYQLGQHVRARYRATKQTGNQHVLGVREELASHYKLTPSTVDLARFFAKKYSPAEVKQFARLRTKSGQPLTRRHVIAILHVPPRKAKSLLAQCCRHNWSTRRLELERKGMRPNRRAAGRRPRQAASPKEVVLQLVDITETWLHWYQTQITQSQLDEPLQGVPAIAKRLKRAEQDLAKIVALTRSRLHGSRS